MKTMNSPTTQTFWSLENRDEPTLSRCAAIMAIVNATPDSFSDGGQHLDQAAASQFAATALAHGARYLDVGGESTRPGSLPVSAAEEQARVLPIISAIQELLQKDYADAHISIDTSKAVVAESALKAGAHIVNDVCAGRDPDMFAVVAEQEAGMVLMHMQGSPESMQDAPHYDDSVFDAVCRFFDQRIEAALDAGIKHGALCLDPGIGFGKTVEQNLMLLASVPALKQRFKLPVLIGLSLKSFLLQVMEQDAPAAQRDFWSHCFHAPLLNQCDILRVHDVCGLRDLIRAQSLLQAYDISYGICADA